MEKHATLDKVIQDLHENFPFLDHECHQEHLLELAEDINHWRTLVPRLGFRPNAVEDLDHTKKNEQEKRQEMLSSWKYANGSRATYRNLATAFLKDKQRDLAEKVLKLSNKPPNEDVPSKANVCAPNRNVQQQQQQQQQQQRQNNDQLNSFRLSFFTDIFCGCSFASSFVSGFGCSLRGSVEADSVDGLTQEDVPTTSHREELVVILSRCYVVGVRSSGGYRFKDESPVVQRACKQNWHLMLRPKHKQHRYKEKARLGEEAHHLDIYSIVTQFLESLASTESATATQTEYERLLKDLLKWPHGNLEKFRLTILLVSWPFIVCIV